MRSHHPNDTITHIAMPERRIPVLMQCAPSKRTGLIPFPGSFRAFRCSPDPTFGYALSVRVLTPDVLYRFLQEDERKGVEQEYGPVLDVWRNRLRVVLALADTASDGGAALQALIKEWPMAQTMLRPSGPFRHGPIAQLGVDLSIGIRDARFVIWWAELERRFAPGIFCPDLRTALFALALSRLGDTGGIGVCKNPTCGKAFVRVRRGQKFHDYRCQTAAGMRRYRAKKDRKAKRKKAQRRR